MIQKGHSIRDIGCMKQLYMKVETSFFEIIREEKPEFLPRLMLISKSFPKKQIF